MPVHVLGVRHHGPGSARSVRAALTALRPDAVVIEGAPELDEVAALAADPQMVPPVAGLVYDLATPRRAAFYPLATFSPEWVALRWALAAGMPVRFADLPAATSFALDGHDLDDHDDLGEDDDLGEEDGAAEAVLLRQDPIAILARAAGYADPERWWEDAVEQRGDRPVPAGADPDPAAQVHRFGLISEAMAQLRVAHPDLDDEENQRREAAMRRVIRDVLATHESVAVVCGAFHAPALDPSTFPAGTFPSRTADNRKLSKLPKVKVGATWAPWTNARLALSSGYGAGVDAPGWYQHVFDTEQDLSTGWLVKVSRALREEQLDASPASTVEAVRLADALAAVRGRPTAGLQELDDAALAVLGEGSDHRLGLVRRRLFVGDGLGQVPDVTPMVPLAADLAKTQKSLRLKPSASQTSVELDLRQPPQLARSVLFHRLQELGVTWAEPTATGRTTGTFKEAWVLCWRPELSVALIEAGLYGNTIETACATRIAESAAQADLPGLSRLIEVCLLADLPDGFDAVVGQLAVQTAHSHDLRLLLSSVEPLARTIRYGTVRGVDTGPLLDLVGTLVTRIGVGLRAGCQALDDESAAAICSAIEATHRGVTLLDDATLAGPWFTALAGLDEQVHGGVTGRVDRILLDAGRISGEEAAGRMSRRLSIAQPPVQSAAWLDGFLTGEAVLLLHDRALLALIDEWVSGIAEDTFEDLLPLLRRSFSRYSGPERRQLGNQLAHDGPAGGRPDRAGTASATADLVRALPAVRRAADLLGLEVRT